MAWLIQFVEDAQQQQHMYALRESHGLREAGTPLFTIIQSLLEDDDDKATQQDERSWEDALAVPAAVVFKRVVHGLLYAPAEAKQLLELDGDPQNFECLLLAPPAFTVRDLLTQPEGDDESSHLLITYAFNLKCDCARHARMACMCMSA